MPSSDRLSSLSSDILLLILALLPAASAVATSALSRRFRNLWSSIPRLDFDSSHLPDPLRIPPFLAQTLSLHSAPLISLRIFSDHEIHRILDILASSAPGKFSNLQELAIHYYQEQRSVYLPGWINRLEFLTDLDLFVGNCRGFDIGGAVRLPALERLKLGGFSFESDFGKDVIRVCFPRLKSWRLNECMGLRFFEVESEVLEELVLDCCVGIADVRVRCSGLKRFVFKHCFVISKFRKCFVFSAKAIEEFSWFDIPPNCFTVDGVIKPRLSSLGVAVAIRYIHCRGALDLLLSLADSRQLDLDSYFFEALFSHLETKLYGGHCLPIFSNVETLQLSICFGPQQAVMLSKILGSVATMKKLNLSFVTDKLPQASDIRDCEKDFVDCGNLGKGGFWDSQCLSFNNLHQVDISNFSGGVYELDFIEYLLRSVASLQIIKIREC